MMHKFLRVGFELAIHVEGCMCRWQSFQATAQALQDDQPGAIWPRWAKTVGPTALFNSRRVCCVRKTIQLTLYCIQSWGHFHRSRWDGSSDWNVITMAIIFGHVIFNVPPSEAKATDTFMNK